MDYRKLYIKDYQGKRTIVTVQVIKETKDWLMGWKVDKYGDRTDNLHLTDKTAITKTVPMTMNLHYGELECTK